MKSELHYPHGKDFIFTIFDDTDVATLENIRPVYDFLYEHGMLTTKSVWPLSRTALGSYYRGSASLEDEEYAGYIKWLSEHGFEIAFHGASMVSNPRQITEEGLEYFKRVLGSYPRSFACHGGNLENVYWGARRFSSFLISLVYRLKNKKEYLGEVPASAYFWGDLCREHIKYVRTFTYDEINLLRISPHLPYLNDRQEYVNACFFTADADNVEDFNALICPENQRRLESERGVCIVTTHIGKGFVDRRGRLNRKTRDLLDELSRRNGWFVPVSDALDFLSVSQGGSRVPREQLLQLEYKWLVHSLRRKINGCNYDKTELQYLSL